MQSSPPVLIITQFFFLWLLHVCHVCATQLLFPLVSSYRYDGDEVNMTLAKSEAKMLHEKISNKAYSDEELIRILATRSKAQINATLNQYKNEFGNDINKVCKIWALL